MKQLNITKLEQSIRRHIQEDIEAGRVGGAVLFVCQNDKVVFGEAFGNKNAIAELSRIVDEIYKIEVPKKEGTRTSYNVGMISGGTSVNTIAQNAEMLCEYRSNDVECLSFMKKKFEEIFENAKKDDV